MKNTSLSVFVAILSVTVSTLSQCLRRRGTAKMLNRDPSSCSGRQSGSSEPTCSIEITCTDKPVKLGIPMESVSGPHVPAYGR